MKHFLRAAIFLLALFLLAVPQTANAQGLSCEKFILGGTYTLAQDESLSGNLCLIAGIGSLEAGSIVEGDVLLLGGNLNANGEIIGDMTVAGGIVEFGETSQVSGDVRLLGGEAFGLNLANIEGETIRNFGLPYSNPIPKRTWLNPVGLLRPLWGLFWLPLRSFLWAGLAILIFMIFPKPVETIGQTVRNQAGISGLMGLGTVAISFLAAVLLAVTIVCIPFSFLLVAAFLASWALGIVALGKVFGEILMKFFKQNWSPLVSLGVGVFTMTLIVNTTSLAVSCLGFFFSFLVGIFGLGAVVLTRFGTQTYPLLITVPQTIPTNSIGTEVPGGNGDLSVQPEEDDHNQVG